MLNDTHAAVMSQIDGQKVVLIAGPTASGKSGLALRIAREHGGMIINADSMQVYRELRIITARPTLDEERDVPHALYGFVPSSEAYSVGRYVRDARQAIAQARARRLLPIVVGGTGLYFKALLEGLSPIPAVSPEIREHWRRRAERDGARALHAHLATIDPEIAARLMHTDTQRIVRALEVAESTGRLLSSWQREPGEPVVDHAETVRVLVSTEREALMQRIDARFDAMLAAGVLTEIRTFASLDLSDDLPSVRAHGVRPLLAYLAGRLSLQAATEGSKAETRQYAKRQVTWQRRNMIAWNVVFAQ